MSEIIAFGISVILISLSGVISPGPLFVANLIYGLKNGFISGLKIAVGHTLVELPIILFLAKINVDLIAFPEFKALTSLLGGFALFAFAGFQVKSIFKKTSISKIKTNNNPVLVGIIFSALNPFFIIWWATIGLKLISDSVATWSWVGIAILFGFHIWLDYVWLSTTAFFSKKGAKFAPSLIFNFIIIILSAILVYFGVIFLTEALTTI